MCVSVFLSTVVVSLKIDALQQMLLADNATVRREDNKGRGKSSTLGGMTGRRRDSPFGLVRVLQYPRVALHHLQQQTVQIVLQLLDLLLLVLHFALQIVRDPHHVLARFSLVLGGDFRRHLRYEFALAGQAERRRKVILAADDDPLVVVVVILVLVVLTGAVQFRFGRGQVLHRFRSVVFDEVL